MRKVVRNILLIIHKLRYPIVLVVGFVLVTFVDEYSLVRHFQLRNQLNDTRDEIARYTEQYERDTKMLKELRHNPRAVERVARERYYMKTDDEDVFVLSDDPRQDTNPTDNETTK